MFALSLEWWWVRQEWTLCKCPICLSIVFDFFDSYVGSFDS